MRRRPVVVAPRRGPGVVGTMARTAVVAGTATVVAKGVSGAVSGSAQQKAQAQQHQAQQAAATQQAQIDASVKQQMAEQQAAMQQQAPAPAPSPDLMAKLQQLAEMKQAGVLSEEEFAAAKAKLLAG